MKRYMLFLSLLAVLLIPNTLINAQVIETHEIISISNNKYDMKILLFNPSMDTDIIYSGLSLKDYHIIPSRLYNEKLVSGDVYWENPDYIIIDGYQTVNAIFDCNENNESIILQVRIFSISNKINKSKTPRLDELIDKPQKINGGIKNLDERFGGNVGCIISDIFSKDDFIFKNENGDIIDGNISFENFNNTKVGIQEIKWVFTPNDSKYEVKVGYREIKLIKQEEVEIPTTPSLTATTISLDTRTAYDINLNDKISGSTYLWSTNDTEIIDINPKNGKIKAKKEGNAKVTCEITLPNGNKNILESLVTVGYDENAPMLTETILDLEVGDKFDINLENKIAKSKYRWISSNRDIVKVNSSNGKVTANGIGEAYVTCTITTPENQVIVLKCDIIVTE